MIDPMKPIIVHAVDGSLIDITELEPHQIKLDDIFYTLSNMPRYGARTSPPYSVLQHSLFLVQLVAAPLKLQALSHDFPEAFLPDIPHAIKETVPEYSLLENDIWARIAARLGLEEISDDVWAADIAIREIEVEFLFPNQPDQGRSHPYLQFLLTCEPAVVREIARQKWQQLGGRT